MNLVDFLTIMQEHEYNNGVSSLCMSPPWNLLEDKGEEIFAGDMYAGDDIFAGGDNNMFAGGFAGDDDMFTEGEIFAGGDNMFAGEEEIFAGEGEIFAGGEGDMFAGGGEAVTEGETKMEINIEDVENFLLN